MGNIVKLVEKEMMRREILLLCRQAAPVGCSRQVLAAALGKLGVDVSELDGELAYLNEKALIRSEHTENKRLGISRDIYMATAAAMDYLDGNGPDIPGIGV